MMHTLQIPNYCVLAIADKVTWIFAPTKFGAVFSDMIMDLMKSKFPLEGKLQFCSYYATTAKTSASFSLLSNTRNSFEA